MQATPMVRSTNLPSKMGHYQRKLQVTPTQKYTQPAEGKVELYWNNQLAIRLYVSW